MALLFMDGFDAGDHALKWTGYTNTDSSTASRFGAGRSVRIASYFWNLYRSIPATTDLYIGFALYAGNSTFGGNYDTYISFNTNGGTAPQLRLQLNMPAGLKVVRLDGTVLATTSGDVLTLNGWQFIEMYVKIADSGGRATVKVNGSQVIDYTGDTKHNGTLNDIDLICFGELYPGTYNYGPRAEIYIDDLYVCDGTGSAPYNTFLGDIRVLALSPSAAGNSTQFTPSVGSNYTTVDEMPYSTTDYVASSTSGNKDTYTMTDLPATTNTVYGIQSNIVARKSDAGPIAVRTVTRSGGTDYTGNTETLFPSYKTISTVRSINPATSTAWTASSVNNMESGIEVV